MIVHEPEVMERKNEILISSKIEIQNPIMQSFPSRLYYAFPIEYEPFVNLQIDAFAFSMLMVAMRLRENLEIKGAISPRLAIGMQEHIKLFSYVYRNLPLHEIEIKFGSFKPSRDFKNSIRFGATSFSGGVDSMHMCNYLQPGNLQIPFTNLKYALFIQGLDNPLEEIENFTKKANEFKAFLEKMGITLITPRTNFILFSQFILPWPSVCHVPVFSAAILLSGLIDQYIIPSTYAYTSFHITGSSLVSDHWIRTEETEIFHFGSHSFIQKLEDVSNIPGYNTILRVCSDKKISLLGNCSRCNKCLRTMAFLKLIEKYEAFPTFTQPFSYFNLLIWGWKDYSAPEMKRMFIKTAFKKKRFLLFVFGLMAALISIMSNNMHHFVKRLIPEKTFLRLKIKLFPSEKDNSI